MKKSFMIAASLCLMQPAAPARAAEDMAMEMPVRPIPLEKPADPAIEKIRRLIADRDTAIQNAEFFQIDPKDIRKDIPHNRELAEQIRESNRNARVQRDVAATLDGIIDNVFMENLVAVYFYCRQDAMRGRDFQAFFPDPACESFNDWKKTRQAKKAELAKQIRPVP